MSATDAGHGERARPERGGREHDVHDAGRGSCILRTVPPAEEVVLPFPAPSRARVPMCTHVKGTWVTSVVNTFRAQSFFDEYVRLLAPEARDVVLGAVTGDWVDIGVLLAHYEACDRLRLPAEEILRIGREASQHAQGSLLSVTARAAARAVMTPWTMLGQLQRFWNRLFHGGGAAVFKLGPKEARAELVQFPGCRYRHCQIATRGVLQTIAEIFCQRAYVIDLPKYATPTQMAVRIAWV
jgi:hypothetical protein